ncbi:glycosyltransferase [Kocuria soli]|uniref:Glycosyltransferase n=1 Tax=Kocuria soli TaxID=2485125 RepID=A0A3N3ZPS8_9MICC|nr:glycosyltransferase [Kocuria soli]ROZ63034.1 glycosyltransferase [Kocuria soli]
MTAARLSVLVPTHGGADRLPVLLAALATQNQAPPFEVCVVVDGDVDGTEAVLTAAAAQYPDLALRYRIHPGNRGRVAALETAAEMARGEILVRCDDDLEPDEHFVGHHARAHADGTTRGVVGLYRNRYPDTPYARAYGREQDRLFRREAYSASSSLRWRYWAGNASVPAAAYRELGGYDPDYRRYGWEDVDFGYRLNRAGVPVVLEPALETVHRVAATTTAQRATRALHAGAARATFVEKHGADVLPGPATHGLWGRCIRLAARATGVGTTRTVGHLIDFLLPAFPRKIARKCIAFIIETADLAGFLYPERARDTF